MLLFGATERAPLLLWTWLVLSVLADVLHIEVIRGMLVTDNASYFVAGAAFYLIWSRGHSGSNVALPDASFGVCLWRALKFAADVAAYYETTINPYVVRGIITLFFVVLLLVSLRHTRVLRRRQWLLLGAELSPLPRAPVPGLHDFRCGVSVCRCAFAVLGGCHCDRGALLRVERMGGTLNGCTSQQSAQSSAGLEALGRE